MTITQDDLAAIKNVVSAFEARFEDWYVTTVETEYQVSGRVQPQISPENREQSFRKDAKKFYFDGLDEDGGANFTSNDGYDDETRYVPFSVVLGTTEEFVARHKEEQAALLAKAVKVREEQAAKRKAEQVAYDLRQKAIEQAKRDRIFVEECKRRGIEVPR